MSENKIVPDDWQRILIGEVPQAFFIEVFFRVLLIYILLLVAMRLMGKRLASRLSRLELTALVTLAAAIGVPIQAPDRGILPAIIIAVLVVSIQRTISALSFRSEKFERIVQGNITMLVQNGVLNMKAMKQTRIPREKIMAVLRSQGVKHLGKVSQLFLEASGDFTLIKSGRDMPGLSILPDWDSSFTERQPKVDDLRICGNCGNPNYKSSDCSNCGASNWVSPVL
jgi:uncharacterized membrane protein YcaP (DUF421 family)